MNCRMQGARLAAAQTQAAAKPDGAGVDGGGDADPVVLQVQLLQLLERAVGRPGRRQRALQPVLVQADDLHVGKRLRPRARQRARKLVSVQAPAGGVQAGMWLAVADHQGSGVEEEATAALQAGRWVPTATGTAHECDCCSGCPVTRLRRGCSCPGAHNTWRFGQETGSGSGPAGAEAGADNSEGLGTAASGTTPAPIPKPAGFATLPKALTRQVVVLVRHELDLWEGTG